MYMSMSHKWKMLPPEQQQYAKWGAVIAPPVMTAAFWSFPSALCYYWTCSNMYTMFMELLLRHPGRALLCMHCFPSVPVPVAPSEWSIPRRSCSSLAHQSCTTRILFLNLV